MELVQWQHRYERWLDENHFTDDAAHDIAHFRRVWMTAQGIMADEDSDPLVVLTACYFHDIVSLPKNHPERSHSSRLAARKTREILSRDFPDFPPDRYAAVEHAIEAHSFSAGIAPQSLEAKIVQDADRLEALGAIGRRASLPSPVRWAPRCLMPTTRSPEHERWMIKPSRSTTFRPNSCACRTLCKPRGGANLRVTMPIF